MSKKATKLLAGTFAAAILLAGCTEGGGTDSGNGSGNTVNTPADFTGNTGDVKIESGDTYAVITIQSFGAITVKLFPEAAPVGVQNFIDLADSGYYTGKEIHRVMSDFMFQGGSRNGDGMSTAEDPSFGVEYNAKMRHFYGALCYANGGGINGSQFYIVNCKSYTPLSREEVQATVDEVKALVDASASDAEREYYQYYYDYYSTILKGLKDSTEEIEAKYREVGGTPSLDGGYTVFGQTVDGFDVIDAVSAVEVEPDSRGELSHPVQKIVIESVEIFTAE
ncbi:MAG: peptidylprolyl isomerase [Oscillospiraceae bacterium]|nr:peptidylprolyl isomerase [Oscillospiraceae bacterium]